MSGLCIYHGGCTDGVAAAWAVWRKFPRFDFYPGVYQQEPPWEKIENAEVVLVDFSYKRDVMERICAMAASVTVLDHHKTARDDLILLFKNGAIGGVFDMDRCGALLAWDAYHSEETPALLSLIDAQDRWLATRDAPTIMALRSYPHYPDDESPEAWMKLMELWSGFMTDEGLEHLKEEGGAIYRYYRARVEETKPHAAPMVIGEYQDVPVVNAPYYLASDAAGELAATAPDGIAACWWRNKDGSVTFSLRSRGDVDVGVLATEFGGGGHPGAAGFRVASVLELAQRFDKE